MNEYKWYDGEMVCSQYGYVNNDTKNSKKHKLPPWLYFIADNITNVYINGCFLLYCNCCE